jgi:hypothetical protein
MKPNGLIETVKKEKLKKQVGRIMDPNKHIQGNTTVCEYIFNLKIFF